MTLQMRLTPARSIRSAGDLPTRGAPGVPQARRCRRRICIQQSIRHACDDAHHGHQRVEKPVAVLSRRAAIVSTGGALAASLCPVSQATQLQSAVTGAKAL